jgi:preprotein translocase subunit YajC
MNLINFSLLMMGSGQGGGQQSPYSGLIMMVLIIAVFYFFIIRPQQKKSKEIQKFRQSLQKGDKIITIGGIHGRIFEINDTTVIIEVEGQNRLKVNREAITKDGSSDQPLTK